MSDEGIGLHCAGCSAAVASPDGACPACGFRRHYRFVALPGEAACSPGPCPACGGDRFDEGGSCADCGARRAAPDRCEADLGAVAMITDRGLVHARNEDAVAAAVLAGAAAGASATTVIAVSDGVSSSVRPERASGAAVRAGVQATVTALADGRAPDEAIMAGLMAAARAVREVDVADGPAPSCTYVSAIVCYEEDAAEITIANVGDSRAYWLRSGADDGPGDLPSRRLSVDDSWAQALVDAGAMDERAAMNDPRAHTLIRWLGADAPARPWAENCVRTVRTAGPGAVLLCSDGLWNYQPDPEALAAQAGEAGAAATAREFTEFAVRCGGGDNITVAVAPVPAPADQGIRRPGDE